MLYFVVMMIIHSQNSTVPAPNIKLVNFERESDMTAGETRTVKVVIAAPQMSVSDSRSFYSIKLEVKTAKIVLRLLHSDQSDS